MKPTLAMRIALGLGLMGGAPGRAQTIEKRWSRPISPIPTQAQRAALRATDELVPQALSDWRPTVAIDSGVAHTDIDSQNGAAR